MSDIYATIYKGLRRLGIAGEEGMLVAQNRYLEACGESAAVSTLCGRLQLDAAGSALSACAHRPRSSAGTRPARHRAPRG